MHQLSGWTSTNTGAAPMDKIAEAVAMNVRAGMITSSPERTPTLLSATSSAVVPPDVQMPYAAVWYAAKRSANSAAFTLGVGKPPQLRLSSTSMRPCRSRSSYWGQGGQPSVLTGEPPAIAR